MYFCSTCKFISCSRCAESGGARGHAHQMFPLTLKRTVPPDDFWRIAYQPAHRWCTLCKDVVREEASTYMECNHCRNFNICQVCILKSGRLTTKHACLRETVDMTYFDPIEPSLEWFTTQAELREKAVASGSTQVVPKQSAVVTDVNKIPTPIAEQSEQTSHPMPGSVAKKSTAQVKRRPVGQPVQPSAPVTTPTDTSTTVSSPLSIETLHSPVSTNSSLAESQISAPMENRASLEPVKPAPAEYKLPALLTTVQPLEQKVPLPQEIQLTDAWMAVSSPLPMETLRSPANTNSSPGESQNLAPMESGASLEPIKPAPVEYKPPALATVQPLEQKVPPPQEMQLTDAWMAVNSPLPVETLRSLVGTNSFLAESQSLAPMESGASLQPVKPTAALATVRPLLSKYNIPQKLPSPQEMQQLYRKIARNSKTQLGLKGLRNNLQGTPHATVGSLKTNTNANGNGDGGAVSMNNDVDPTTIGFNGGGGDSTINDATAGFSGGGVDFASTSDTTIDSGDGTGLSDAIGGLDISSFWYPIDPGTADLIL